MWQNVNILLFAAALFFVLYFTLIMRSHRDDSCISLNIIAKLLRIKGVDDLEREVIMNAVLFFPLGLAFSQIICRENAGKAFRTTVAFAFLLSFCVEALQVAFSCGTAELSDLLLNTFGAAVGALPVLIAEKVK